MHSPITLSRRSFVSVMALLGAARIGGVPLAGPATAQSAATTAIDFDAFMASSKTLIGGLEPDADMGKLVLQGFLDLGMGDKLAAVVADPAKEGQTETANQLVAAWYTGLTPDGKKVTSFTDALMWPAMSYTKPWAECGDEYGYWGDAPAAQ
ncbi:sugar dehydrogenase complex small subunit [Paracoccus pacificus]|uniref:Sugar dehydrogenase complex small subunit n=1 Tax=Paracoccus pacificus TaxID=1463598 RepID=A0ABW4R7Q5_9RHOB